MYRRAARYRGVRDVQTVDLDAVSGEGLDTANARCVRWGGPAATGGWRSGPVWVAKRSTRGS
jgi:hypothetical protein